MSNNAINEEISIERRIEALTSIQYKILEELNTKQDVELKLISEIKYLKEELVKSMNNEKELLLLIQQQKDNINKVEKKYSELKNSSAVKLVFRYWKLRKKILRR